ncbi:MAG: 2-oxo acid dehydrogenase subunit E2, partial [Acidobacteria bacterium]|nr:2-oxo acid dehydrogenase subunit E2 [Acidobacteriota bacterium]
VEMEAYTTGVIRKLVASEGDTIAIGGLIAVIGAPDEDIAPLLAAQPAAPIGQASRLPEASRLPDAPVQAPAPAGRSLRASPLALKMAAESGLDLASLVGSGPQGRIIKRDIEAALEAAHAVVSAADAQPVVKPRAVDAVPGREEAPDVQNIELSTIRRTIARRLVQSKGPIPHFYLTVDVAMDRLWRDYQALREQKLPISINDVIIKATASALRHHPELNASFAGDHVKQFGRVHIGMAVALDDGLITPVIRDADLKPIEQISAEARVLVERARAGKLQPGEYTGATFSISNLGMMGIEEFSAIINPPEAGILAVGAVRQTPVVENGELRAGYRMKLTLSVDHRVADGAMAARFLQTLTRMLENPLLIA